MEMLLLGFLCHLRPRLDFRAGDCYLLQASSVKRDNEQYQVIRIETVGDKEEFSIVYLPQFFRKLSHWELLDISVQSKDALI